MKKVSTFLVFMFCVSLLANVSLAQNNLGLQAIGGRVSFVDPEGAGGGSIGIGGHADFGEITQNLHLYPSAEYWSKGGFSSFSFNGDARYYFPTSGNIRFCGGGGLGLLINESNLDLGLNILGGADFPVSENLVANAEIKFVISDFNVLKLTGGITYLLSQ